MRKDATMAQFMISVFHDPGIQSSGEAYQSEDDMQFPRGVPRPAGEFGARSGWLLDRGGRQ